MAECKGIHNGVKKGKTFAAPASPNRKQAARLKMRIIGYNLAYKGEDKHPKNDMKVHRPGSAKGQL